METFYSYEYSRDARLLPACWRTENDGCRAHFHSSIEIVYVTHGELRATLNGIPYFVRAGQLLIVPSYTIHAYETERSSGSLILIFPLDFVSSCKPLLMKKTFASYILDDPVVQQELLHTIESVERLLAEDVSPCGKLTVKGYLYVLLGLLIERVGLADQIDNAMTAKAQEVLLYLQEHCLEPLTLEAAAQHFGYSKSRFSHIFNQYFGCSLPRYLNGLRCQRALELLREKRYSITEVALSSGFESIRTFYRAFHSCFGLSPVQYAETVQLQKA